MVVDELLYTYPALVGRLALLAGRQSRQTKSLSPAVNKVSFSLKDGQSLGLVGSNGAGKTTLLRLLAGVLEPTSGRLSVNGSISTMFDSGYGMDPNFTPESNVRTRGLILGRGRVEIEAAISDIRDFVDLGDAWSQPMRTYSTGMSSRIVVGTATGFGTRVLLMDEAIGAADVAFQAKAAKRLNGLLENTGCMVMATHNQKLMRQFCDLALVMKEGRVAFSGSVEEAWEHHKNGTL